ncbi:MAG TPA: sulfatase-like hydrolase/transferase [Vicinamibacterales bacterium]|nr:sulfatase-like hydrolase/transferase [Vicinamibacterales bacterium]
MSRTSPSRRRAPQRSFAVAAALVVLAGAAVWLLYGRGARDAFPPFVPSAESNVLLVTIDTLRADALGSYGGRARTPNLDRLAEDGVRFTFAHAHAVVTLPSHASILTGRYPFEHGVRDNAGFRLGDEALTLAEMARARGMATGAFIGAFPLNREFGLAQGFDVYDDLGGLDVAPSDFAFSERPAGEVVEKARAWIGAQHGPWLAWVHVFDPHSPYAPPPPYAAEYARDPYAGEVAYTDSALGPLLDLARAATRPTTIIVTSDHGEGLGDHGEATHGVFAYESTLRVPLIVAQAGAGTREARGAVSDAPVRHVDILPTIGELAGLTLPADLPGRSLLAVETETSPRASYFEAMTAMLKRGWAPLSGVLDGREKYIDLPVEELYDLAADPGETRNLAPASAARVRVLTARLAQFGPALPSEQTDENAEVRARLQSLGYLSGSAPRKARYTEEDDPKRLIDVDRLMMQGIELHRAGRSAEAMEAYRRVIERRPDMELAYRRLAYIQWEAGQPARAIATMREAIGKNGRTVEAEVRLGTYLAESGQAAEALPLLERATTADPGHIEGLNALGIAYARAGRPADALRTFARILETRPNDAFALENTGAVHLQQGYVGAAAEAFAKAVEHNPRSSRGHAGLGVVALKAGRRDEAIGHFTRAVQFDPRNFDALYNLASELIAAGRLAEARPVVDQFARTAPRAFYGPDIERLARAVGR